MNIIESYVDKALVRVCDLDGQTAGTGFVISPEGHVLTCHHVVGNLPDLLLKFAGGDSVEINVKETANILPECDLVVINSGVKRESILSIAFTNDPPKVFWTKGFQFQEKGFTDAVPVDGTISGQTSVTYHVANKEYNLTGVWALSRGDVNKGMSGAPLVDSACLAVTGIVAAHLPGAKYISGLAIPFIKTQLKEKLDQNVLKSAETFMPRYGKLVNIAGVMDLCARQRREAINHLKDRKLYLPEYYIERTQLTQSLNYFFNNSKLIFPLVGYSGVGKTMILAHLADSSENPCSFFIRGLDIRDPYQFLDSIVIRYINETLLSRGFESPDFEILAQRTQENGKIICFLLDGLNEARITEEDLVDIWIPRTLTWIISHGARLIVSCRPEAWEKISCAFSDYPIHFEYMNGLHDKKSYFYHRNVPKQRKSFINLDDFSLDEAKQAALVYGLDKENFQNFFRHPFTMRIMWEIQSLPSFIEQMNQCNLLESYLHQKCTKVARKAGRQISANRVRHCLETLAEKIAKNISHIFLFEEFDKLSEDKKNIVVQLVSEHILDETLDGYRFSFDEVADYLQSSFISIDSLLNADDFLFDKSSNTEIPESVAIYAFLRESLKKGTEWTLIWLQRLRDRLLGFSHSQNLYRWFHFALKISFIVEYDKKIEGICREITNIIGQINYPHIFMNEDWNILHRSQWPEGSLLRLIKPFVRFEEDTFWRNKEWTNEYYRENLFIFNVEDKPPFVELINYLVKKNPHQVLNLLLDWLDDNTKLETSGDIEHSEATVGDVAAACLFHHRTKDFNWLCDQLIQSPNELAWTLLITFAETDGSSLLPLCKLWLKKNIDPKHILHIVEIIANYSENRSLREYYPKMWLDLMISMGYTTSMFNTYSILKYFFCFLHFISVPLKS